MTYTPPPALVAAVLSDEVYQDTTFVPPPGWVNVTSQIGTAYNSGTGYYGEVWVQEKTDPTTGAFLPAVNDDGSLNKSNIASAILVNRGTVITQALSGSSLYSTYTSDLLNTWGADLSVVLTGSTGFVTPGQTLLTNLQNAFSGTDTPIIVTGQSLGGYTADDEAVAGLFSPPADGDTNISADTFNSLPFTASDAESVINPLDPTPLTSGQENILNAKINNYYVGNEVLTGLPGLGTAVGVTDTLPNVPTSYLLSPTPAEVMNIHSAESGIAELFNQLYPDSSAPDYDSAITWLASVFPDPQGEVATLLGHDSPTNDTNDTTITQNPDGTYTITTNNADSATTGIAEQASVFTSSKQLLYRVQFKTDGSATYTFNNSSDTNVTFDKGTGTFSNFNASTDTLTATLTDTDGSALATLVLNTVSDTGTVTLPTGKVYNVSASTNTTIADPIESASQILADYLSDLGYSTSASTLDADNFTYLNPTGTGTYTVTGSSDGMGNENFTSSDGAPGAIITGVSGQNNILTAQGDLSQDNISGIQVLNVSSNVTLLGDEFKGFTTIEGNGTITISQAPSSGADAFSLSGIAGTFNLAAQNWDGTTLTDNNANGETLTASLFGNDTLNAGNGTDDTLIAGEGVDTLNGGTGGDTFEALDGLASGSSITGHSGDTLEAGGDISGASISGVGTLLVEDDVTLTASQVSGFSTVSGGDVIQASGAGTYSLSGNSNLFDMYADPTANTTLIGGTAADELLSADGTSGNDTLEAGSGNSDEVSAADSTGTDTLTVGNGTGDTLVAGLAARV